MQVRTITGKSLPAALKRAKEVFGNDVILLESKEAEEVKSDDNGKLVQVTVSVPEDAKTVRPWQPPKLDDEKPEPAKTPKSKSPKNDFNKVIGDILARKPQELHKEEKILEELAEMRRELNALSKKNESGSISELPEAYSEVASHLLDKGFDEGTLNNLIKRVYQFLENGHEANNEDIIKGLKLELKRKFQNYNFQPDDEAGKQKVILLVGATGVGKTSIAMKLAAHPDIFGKTDVAIVSTDLYGPSEALKAFSNMTGATIYEGKQTDEIKDLLEKFKEKEVIIVDTPGQSPFAPNHLGKLEDYIRVLKPTDIFLVLSMSTDLKDLFLACAVYLMLKPTGVVFTKFDETTQPGKVFTVLDELNVPAVSFSEGKRVFIDIEPANIEFLLNKVFDIV